MGPLGFHHIYMAIAAIRTQYVRLQIHWPILSEKATNIVTTKQITKF